MVTYLLFVTSFKFFVDMLDILPLFLVIETLELFIFSLLESFGTCSNAV